MASRDGDCFEVCDVATCPALKDAQVATYATAIRSGGATNGKAIGVLGIFFDWNPQAQTIVSGVNLGEGEQGETRIMLLDSKFRIIASTHAGSLGKTYPLRPTGERGHYRDGGKLVGYGLTPGYETDQGLGWYGCIEGACDN